MDRELNAMNVIAKELEPLNAAQRGRVLAWLQSRTAQPEVLSDAPTGTANEANGDTMLHLVESIVLKSPSGINIDGVLTRLKELDKPRFGRRKGLRANVHAILSKLYLNRKIARQRFGVYGPKVGA